MYNLVNINICFYCLQPLNPFKNKSRSILVEFKNVRGASTHVIRLGQIDVAVVIVVQLLMQRPDRLHAEAIVHVAQALHVVRRAGAIRGRSASRSTCRTRNAEKNKSPRQPDGIGPTKMSYMYEWEKGVRFV